MFWTGYSLLPEHACPNTEVCGDDGKLLGPRRANQTHNAGVALSQLDAWSDIDLTSAKNSASPPSGKGKG
jgi:hypothetical protein